MGRRLWGGGGQHLVCCLSVVSVSLTSDYIQRKQTGNSPDIQLLTPHVALADLASVRQRTMTLTSIHLFSAVLTQQLGGGCVRTGCCLCRFCSFIC